MQLLRAAIKRGDTKKLLAWFRGQAIELPQISSTKIFTAKKFQSKITAFNQLHKWQHADIHPCFPQLLGLKQHIDTLLHKSSPFPLMGLIHLQNNISVIEPLRNDDFTIDCRLSSIDVHSKGITADIDLDVKQYGQTCLTAKSTYLYRVMHDINEVKSSRAPLSTDLEPLKTLDNDGFLTFSNNTSRKYARISGDYNPIHLYEWSAKLFGFKTSIAHGMNVLALALSRVEKDYEFVNLPYSISNEFINPVLLPCELVLQSSCTNQEPDSNFRFELINPKAASRKQLVLSGIIRDKYI